MQEAAGFKHQLHKSLQKSVMRETHEHCILVLMGFKYNKAYCIPTELLDFTCTVFK